MITGSIGGETNLRARDVIVIIQDVYPLFTAVPMRAKLIVPDLDQIE
jgi:hypothetical protein